MNDGKLEKTHDTEGIPFKVLRKRCRRMNPTKCRLFTHGIKQNIPFDRFMLQLKWAKRADRIVFATNIHLK